MERLVILNHIKEAMYCPSVPAFEELMNKEITMNENAINYLDKLFFRKEEWAICYRHEVFTRGQHTNNIVERAFLRLKENVLHRSKCFNAIQLTKIICKDLMYSFTTSVLDVIRNPLEKTRYYEGKSMKKGMDISMDRVNKLHGEGDFYTVDSEDGRTSYMLNSETGICTCYVGMSGAYCKHQLAVMHKYGKTCVATSPFLDEDAKRLLCQVALGEQDIPDGFYFRPSRHGDVVVSSVSRNEIGPPGAGIDPAPECLEQRDDLGLGSLTACSIPHAAENVELLSKDTVLLDTEKEVKNCIGNIFQTAHRDPETCKDSVMKFSKFFLKTYNPERRTPAGLASVLEQTVSGVQTKVNSKNIKVNDPSRTKYLRKGFKGNVSKNSNFEVRPDVPAQDDAYQVPSRKRKKPHSLAAVVKAKRAEVEASSTSK